MSSIIFTVFLFVLSFREYEITLFVLCRHRFDEQNHPSLIVKDPYKVIKVLSKPRIMDEKKSIKVKE